MYIDKDYKPVEITVSKPNRIKFNQGFFNPLFKDVITFDINDGTVKETDLLLSNTKVKEVYNIQNYPCNKVFSNKVKVKENYFLLNNYHLFATDWDNNIYRLYQDESTFNTVPGYTNGIIDKTMFGSKCMKVSMEYITLDKWSDKVVVNNA